VREGFLKQELKLSLAGSLKINDKLEVRAFAGPETGIDDTGGFDPTRRPEQSRNERAEQGPAAMETVSSPPVNGRTRASVDSRGDYNGRKGVS
jgi:hypothetical protein